MKAEVKNTIGARIKECRKAKGLSQEQLAEILLTSKMTISNYENDKYDLSSSTLKMVADALDTSVSYLVDGVMLPSESELILLEVFRSLGTDGLQKVAMTQLRALVDLQNSMK